MKKLFAAVMLVASTAVAAQAGDAEVELLEQGTLNGWKRAKLEDKEGYANVVYALWWRRCPLSMTRSEFRRELVAEMDKAARTDPHVLTAQASAVAAQSLGCNLHRVR
jgi:hypothetical protein